MARAFLKFSSDLTEGHFNRFADVFDDVIEVVLARGVIGDVVDGYRVRGAVGV